MVKQIIFRLAIYYDKLIKFRKDKMNVFYIRGNHDLLFIDIGINLFKIEKA